MTDGCPEYGSEGDGDDSEFSGSGSMLYTDAAAAFNCGGFMAGGEDGCSAAAATKAGAALNKQERLKEKNRLAQRRFRARQKSMLEQMQSRMDDLGKQVSGGVCSGHVGCDVR
jgi:hypothetical protein